MRRRWDSPNRRPLKAAKYFGVFNSEKNWRTPKVQQIEIAPGRVVEFVYDPVSRTHSAFRFFNESRLAVIDAILDDWLSREAVADVFGGKRLDERMEFAA